MTCANKPVVGGMSAQSVLRRRCPIYGPRIEYEFVPMTREYAHAIVDQWKYGGEYSIYDYSNEAEHMLDPTAWGVGLFAVSITAASTCRSASHWARVRL